MSIRISGTSDIRAMLLGDTAWKPRRPVASASTPDSRVPHSSGLATLLSGLTGTGTSNMRLGTRPAPPAPQAKPARDALAAALLPSSVLLRRPSAGQPTPGHSPTPAETAKADDRNDRKINHPIRTMLSMGHRDFDTAA
jgi:hypothetical protein